MLAAHAHIAHDKKRAADKWLRDCERRVLSLAKLPRRYEIIPEAEDLGDDIRHDLFGNYRIIYRVEGDKVTVLRVIHSSRVLDFDALLSE